MNDKLVVTSLSDVVVRDFNTKKLLAYFPELRATNLSIEATPDSSSGGKGGLQLVAFNENYNVALTVDIGNTTIWALKALTNGAVSKEMKEITDTFVFRGRVGELPVVPSSLEIYKQNDFENKLSDYTLIDKTITLTGVDEFSTQEHFVVYNFQAEVLNIVISPNQVVPLFTIHANVELQNSDSRNISKMYITIPKARIANVFNLLMTNLNGGNENHTLEIEAMKDKNAKGLAVIQVLD